MLGSSVHSVHDNTELSSIVYFGDSVLAGLAWQAREKFIGRDKKARKLRPPERPPKRFFFFFHSLRERKFPLVERLPRE